METCLRKNWVQARKAYSMSRSFVRKRALYKKNSTEERSFSDGNNLDCETIYSQTLTIKDSTLDDIVQEYTENVVNDSQHVFHAGPVFYKGSIICERFSSEYTIHFYLYTRTTWNEDIKSLLKKTYLEPFSKQLPSLSLKSEKLLEPWRFVVSGSKSSILNHDTISNPEKQVEKLEREMIISFLNGTSLTRWTFIDILKDMYMFDVNHVTFLARWVHFLATPVNIILSMMFLSQFYLLGGRPDSIINLNLSHLLILIVVASYMRLGTIRNCELWGITVSVVLLCLSLTGRSLYIRICGYDSCSEGIYFLPIVLGFFTSLCQISSDFLYADPNTGDVTLEMLKEILVDVTFETGLTLDDRLRQVFWFFSWTIPSTFMSWVHQLGVQVAFVMTNIGYRPPDSNAIVKYLKRCDKNSLDIYHRLPKSCNDISRMTMSSPCVLALKECGLMKKKESLTTNETLSLCVSIRLCSIYLRKY